MTQFWIICGALLVVALAFVVLPLWRSRVRNNDVVRDAANLEIFRDQIAEMDADLANGLLTPELYEQGKRELQARVLDEVKSPEGEGGRARDPHRKLAIALALLIPVASLMLYAMVGNLNAFLPQSSPVAGNSAFGTVGSEAGLDELKKKLQSDPDNAEGWLVLARSYAQFGRFPEAVSAYRKLVQLVPNEAQMWFELADSLAMANNQSMLGEPTALVEKALSIDPAHQNALALAGSAAMERGDYSAAIRHWEALLKQLPKDSEQAKMVAGGLAQAHQFKKMSERGQGPAMPKQKEKIASSGKERVTGVVTLSDVVKDNASPEDTVFVVARAMPGPQMPLAVIRKKVKDLPLEFSMDDSMAMAEEMKLSNFDQIVVFARVSKTGEAKPSEGDLEGVSALVKPGAKNVQVVINNRVKAGK